MNLIITKNCNKNCSFCFANEHIDRKPKEMTLADFLKFLDFLDREPNSAKTQRITLGGGEPTTHSQFNSFTMHFIKRHLHFSLISNGLYNEKISRSIIAAANSGCLDSILLNAAELKDTADFDLFKKNYFALIENNSPLNIVLSLTLSKRKTPAEEISYFEWLLNNIKIHKLRISLDYPKADSDAKYFLKNLDYGKKLEKIAEHCLKNKITLIGDCLFFPCLFENIEKFENFKNKLKNFTTSCGKELIPFDILPDLSYQHCYSAGYLGENNILAYKNFTEAYEELSKKKELLLNKKAIPIDCQSCKYFINKKCNSLCLGCFTPNSQAFAE